MYPAGRYAGWGCGGVFPGQPVRVTDRWAVRLLPGEGWLLTAALASSRACGDIPFVDGVRKPADIWAGIQSI